ncbi:uncharacterized protein KY384_008150 [Bacidia gigantensis]|uniref:uncharacterized protein n=1 Tax=Bacidia gigantensis TaxID=2732470 RepID=UPI001D03F701|nr:uncharacterized protein KY384_008150 [Bacidia gigantensis]KAG8526721.1 hypothetical protein KY384_008150 [Bacidia gigantensis]
MNWTGGSLYRSRNANASLTAIQKKHFAKIRAKRNAPQPSPHPADPFAFLNPQPGGQRTLHEFAETQPIASRLEGIKPRRNDIKRERSATPAYAQSQVKPTSQHSRPISISSRSSDSSSSNDASPPPQPSQDDNDDESTHSLEAYRRRLLATSDWIGINCTKPARVNFIAMEDREQIGKRRRLSQIPDYDPTRRTKQRPKRTSYFDGQGGAPRLSQDYVSLADVSVRIGSTVEKSLRQGGSCRGNSPKLAELNADEMLLDDEVAESEDRFPNPFRNGYLDSENWISDQRDGQLSQYRRSSSPASPTQAQKRGSAHRGDVEMGKTIEESKSRKRKARLSRDDLENAGSAEVSDYFLSLDHPNAYHSSTPTFHTWSGINDAVVPGIHMMPRLSNVGSDEVVSKNEAVASSSEFYAEAQDESIEHPHEEDEEKIWKEYVNFDGDHGSMASQPRAQPYDLTTNKPITPIPRHDTLEASHRHNKDPQIATEATLYCQEKEPMPAQDDETLWRSFVFGNECSNDEGDLEEPTSSSRPNETQPSIMAEQGTSPVKQNPHLLEETPVDDDSSKALTGMDTASMQAQADDGDISQEEAKSEWDDLQIQFSSDAALQEPPTPSSANHGNRLPSPRVASPSSIEPQPSSTFTSPIPTPSLISAAQIPPPVYPPRSSASLRQPLLFKKPDRYQGTSQDLSEPTIIGASLPRSIRSARLKAQEEILRDEVRGLGFEDPNGGRQWIDEIEDD